MKPIEGILEYQAQDRTRLRALDEIERSDDNLRMEQARVEFNRLKKVRTDLEAAAQAIVEFYPKAQAYFKETMAKFEELSKLAETTEDFDKLAEILDALTSTRSKLIELERKMVDRGEKGAKLVEDFRSAEERAKKMMSIHATSKARLDELRKEKEPLIRSVEAKLRQLASTIDPVYLGWYNELAAEKKMPPFVPLSGSETCGGCGIGLSQKTLAELKDKRVCRCDTCRRVVYLR